jgi:hypothetical protein
MAVSKFLTRDWLLGWLVPSGNGTAAVQAVVLTDTTGAPVTTVNGAGYSGVVTSAAAGSTTAAQLLPANPNRRGATIYYDAAAILYLLEGTGVPSSTNFTYKLGSGLFTAYEAPAGFTGAIQGVFSAGTGSAYVTERS